MLLLLTLHPEWDATLGRNHTKSNASKNLGSGAEPPVRIHIIKNDFDFIFYVTKTQKSIRRIKK
jgi:hypothetical protein